MACAENSLNFLTISLTAAVLGGAVALAVMYFWQRKVDKTRDVNQRDREFSQS